MRLHSYYYTTQAGSAILFFNVVIFCETNKLLVDILVLNSFVMHRDMFKVFSIHFLPNICQNITLNI